MNERIRELAEQADLIQWDALPSGARTPNYESFVKANRFAEMIVKECIAITNDQYFAYEAVEELQKHFGVKE